MASSNVDYYQKQKDLQDSMLENEQKRKRLEAQLETYCRSDQRMSKLRAVKLQNYWKKICEDEKRSKQRNSSLLRDLDRVESNMASLAARREKLKHMKQQYFDYIERTYPKWMELVLQKKQEHQQQQNAQQQQQFQQQQQQFQQQQQQPQQQYQQQQQESQLKQYQQQQQQYQQQQQQQSHQTQPQYFQSSQQGYQGQQQQQQQHYQQQQYQSQQHQDHWQDQEEEEEEEVPPPLPRQPPPASDMYNGYDVTLPEREYTNLKDIQRQHQPSNSAQQSIPSVTVHMPRVGEGESGPSPKFGRPDSGKRRDNASPNWMAAEKDTSIHSLSEQDDVPISQPVQSVTVRQKSDPPKPVIQGNPSEEDISEFSDEPDLPSAEGPPPSQPTQSNPHSSQVSNKHPGNNDEDDDIQVPRTFQPDVSSQGLLRLLKLVEEDISKSLAVEAFYRSRNPDPATRKEIIHKANTDGSLATVDGEFLSMVVLEQLTPVVRKLPGGCILSDVLLVRKIDSLTDNDIRNSLHRDCQVLWEKLLSHFVCLVKNRVMGTREVAHVFVPCIVHNSSQHQDKAVALIEQILEKIAVDKPDGRDSPVQQDSITVDTMASSQQGGKPDYNMYHSEISAHFMNANIAVPRLKFGSLVDSKPISDEESSVMTQSMTTTEGPKVPLNETAAYKNLLAGNRPVQTAVVADDTDDNSDNDLEKQFVSTLSPRSHASKQPFPNPSTDIPSSDPVVRDGSHDQAGDQSHDFEEPHSDVNSPLPSPVYVPTGAEPSTIKSILGSTGGSSQQRKLAGMISSDLDTDTEVDIGTMGTKKEDDDDDDFYDFYG